MTKRRATEGMESSIEEVQSTGQLGADEILVAEFEYISQTAFQANEDRARVSTFFLVTAGSLVAAMLGVQFEYFQVPHAYWALAALFVGLALNSMLTLLQLVRLRQAWFDSILAMNQIKDFYTHLTQGVSLGQAFRWSNETLPARFRPLSISFLLAIQVALLGGVTLGAALFLIGLGYHKWWWKLAISSGSLLFVLEIILYWRLVRRSA